MFIGFGKISQDNVQQRRLLKQRSWIKKALTFLVLFVYGLLTALSSVPSVAQTATSFNKRFQTNDTGNIVFIGNTTLTCLPPSLDVSITRLDENGGTLVRNDFATYTITVTNNGSATATNVILTDPQPNNTTYVPNSLKIGGNTKTDTSDSDEANFVSSTATFRLGSSANGSSGGSLTPGQSATVSFRVQVSSTVNSNTNINNTATVAYTENSLSPSGSATASSTLQMKVASSTATIIPANPSCSASRSNSAGGGQNNDFNMYYVDVDGDSSTFSSSQAQLNLPADSTVLFAGLYWGGYSTKTTERNKVRLKTPQGSFDFTATPDTSGNPTTANSDFRTTSFSNSPNAYQGFIRVTDQVKIAGNGTYTVANVSSDINTTNRWGGWSLVIAYRAPGDLPRNLTVYDGLTTVDQNNPVDITVKDFITPPFGAVKVQLGTIAYDGDNGYGSSAGGFTGDQFKLNGSALSNALNPLDDIFNGSITYLGNQFSAKNPNYANQLGYDADIFDASGILGNGATTAKVSLNTGGETIIPGVITSAIDLYAPNVKVGKVNQDINGGEVEIGDILEYAITVTNNKDANGNGDPADNNIVFDAIPINTTYVPGSLKIDGIPKTDTSDDDQADFDTANNRTIFRIGNGATGLTGGTLSVNQNAIGTAPSPGSSSTMTFRASINADIPDGTQIKNQAEESFKGTTLGQGVALAADSPAVKVLVDVPTGLSINKTDSPDPVKPGQELTYTISVTNGGPSAATNVAMDDPLPAGTTFNSLSPPSGWSCTTPTVGGSGSVRCTKSSFALPSSTATYPISAKFILKVQVASGWSMNLTNIATVSYTNGATSGSDSATEETALDNATPHLSLVKRITALNGNVISGFDGITNDPNSNGNTSEDQYWPIQPNNLDLYLRGKINLVVKPQDEVEYTIYYLNTQRTAYDITLCDLIPVHQTFVQTGYNAVVPHPTEISSSSSYTGIALGEGALTLPTVPTVYLTNAQDGDRGYYYPPNAPNTPAACKLIDASGGVSAAGPAANTNGAVVVNVVTGKGLANQIPPATAPGNPPKSYGFVRFKTKLG
jgi:uncharacterized repeat protein (TIGR01451 family)